MKRLVCAVEGDGEVQAIPNLCARILLDVGATGWIVEREPIRRNRSKLVDASQPGPRRTCRPDEIELIVEMAIQRRADALLVLCDEDDDCAKSWGLSAAAIIRNRLRGDAVMAVREYESWLLWSQTAEARAKAGASSPDKIRNAKGALSRIVPGYKPSTHQLAETRRLDIARVRAASKSFAKLVRAITALSADPG
jgi:hypothetical protein